MKNIVIVGMLACTLGTTAQAQDNQISIKTKSDTVANNSDCLSIGPNGINYTKKGSVKSNSTTQLHWGLMDLGLNFLHDKSVYDASNAQVQQYGVAEDWFDLRNGRSWNVNIYPVMASLKAVNHKKFVTTFYTGLGFQINNFRYKKSLEHHTSPSDKLSMSNVTFSKNKLALNYAVIPVMVNFKHKIDKQWLCYGFGAQFGYLLNAWTKQQGESFSKTVKNKDLSQFNDFNVNLMGEIGIGSFRLFGSYQLNNMYKNMDIKQHPVSIGIRLGQI